MSRFNIFASITVCTLLLTACGGSGDTGGDDTLRDGRISLSAGVEAMEENTPEGRASIPQAAVVNHFSPENPLTAAVWFSAERGKYSATPQDAETHLPAHIDMTFKERSKPAFACYDNINDLYLRYKSPDPDDKVYCIGLYPATDWTWDESAPTKATHEIKGYEDLMFANEIEGDWSSRFGDGLRFGHLLTWVTVVVLANSHDAIEQWGDITRLEIKSQPTVTVTLADGTVEFSGDDSPFVVSDTQVPLHITSYEIASVLCSPKTSYELTLETERMGVKNVTIPIKDPDGNPITDASGLIGKNIVITLYFGNVLIDGRCTLEDWIHENEELHIYTPKTD